MSTVLLAWELGAGAGHCVNFLPIASGLLERGHRVCVASRDLVTARRIFVGLDVEHYPAAFLLGKPDRPIAMPRNFAHILHNTGFESEESLEALVAAWRQLFAAIGPDLIVCEHAPTALLASRFTAARRAVLGTGFFSPPKVSPLPALRHWEAASQEQDNVEDAVAQRVNAMLSAEKRHELTCLAELYSDVDENCLLTFAKLDHYPHREDGEYFGMWSPAGGEVPEWPSGKGAKLFAYLKPSHGSWNLPGFLTLLAEVGNPTLVYTPDYDPRLRQLETPQLKIVRKPLDIGLVSADCDAAILNGNAGTSTELLLAGVPQLHIPMFLEQEAYSRRVVDLGASLMADSNLPLQAAGRLFRLLDNRCFYDGAQAFKAQHAEFRTEESIDAIVGRLHRLASV